MFYDITRTIGLDTLTFPGDTPLELERLALMSSGDSYNLTAMRASCHTGTHLDAPWHFVDAGARLSDLPLSRFIMRAHVVDATQRSAIGLEAVAGLQLEPGDAVLFKTDNAGLSRAAFSEQVSGLTPALAQHLAQLGVGLAGIDYLSIELGADGTYPVHAILLGAGMLILEEADLSHVPPGTYRLYCLPLRLYQTEAAPVRAVLKTLD